MSPFKEEAIGVNAEKSSRLLQLVRCANVIHSINRLHTLWEVRRMNDYERHFALNRRAETFIEERNGILIGSIVPSSGTTKSKLLRSCRGRLQRTILVATEFGIRLDLRPTDEREAQMHEIEDDMRQMEPNEESDASLSSLQ